MNAGSRGNSQFLAGRNINGYYTFHLFINFAFWLPIYAVFFLTRGLDYSAILLLYAVDNGVQTTLEIPSGMLADRWGRRPVLMLGALIQVAGYLMIAFGDGMAWYLFAMALHGAALAFLSGSDAAFIYDSLAAAGREKEFKKIEGRAYMFNLVGWGVGGLLGGWLAVKNLSLPYIMSAITSVLALFVIAICIEPPRRQKYPTPKKLAADVWGVVRNNKSVRAIIVFASLIFGFLLVSHKFSQPYLQEAGLNLELFGIVYFVWLMGAAMSSYYSERLEKALGSRVYFLSLPLVVGGVLIYFGFFQNILGVTLALLYQFVWGSLRPQMNHIINREVGSSMRATVLSTVGFGSAIIYIIAAPLIGWIADRYYFPQALFWLGIIALVFCLWAAIPLLCRKSSPARPGSKAV
jgi:MFS family permease